MTEAALRPSTRVKTAAVSTAAEAAPAIGGGSVQEAYEERDEEFQENQDDEKKRKADQPKENAKKRAGSQPPSAKRARTRGTRGVLGQIMEMPFDILYEIFIRLPPADLLSIGRTSKDLKDLVLDQGFRAIWSQSLSATGLPPCPENMTQPAYAELAFGDTCWTCGGKEYVGRLWRLRLKLCSECQRKPEFRSGFAYQPLLDEQLPKELFSGGLLPGYCFVIGGTYYSKKHAIALSEEYSALNTEEEKAEWVKATVQRLSAASMHADKCRVWYREYLQKIEKQEQRKFTQRQARVIKMAKEMGWEEEMSKMGWKFKSRDEIRRMCNKPINDRVIENVKATINKLMTSVRADRISSENKQKLVDRMKTLSKAYDEALTLHYPPTERRPLICDIFVVPHIRTLISDIDKNPDLTLADFKLTKETLVSIVKDAYDIINAKILQVISNGLGKKGYDPTTVLNLATTLFANHDLKLKRKMSAKEKILAKECSFLTVPEILVCSSSSDPSRRNPSNLEQYAYKAFGYLCTWKAPHGFRLHKVAHDIAGQLLKLCKLDPTTTTLDEIEELQPILECYDCNCADKGRQVLTWDAAISHIINCHASQVDSQKIVLMDGPDAERARAAIKDKKRRLLHSDKDAQTVCLRCNETAKLGSMLDHLRQKHGVASAGEEDFALAYVSQRKFTEIGRPDGDFRM